jgi:hypothetical protein
MSPSRASGLKRPGLPRRAKKDPGKPGSWSGGRGAVKPAGMTDVPATLPYQRPKCGRSPLRMAIRACAISRPSTTAMKRPNNVEEGVRSKEAVLDMVFPYCGSADAGFSGQSRYTRCQQQFICLHSSILSFAMQHDDREGNPGQVKGPPETGGPETFSRNSAYSAATLRGGSSAPEAWISATW